MTRAIVTGGSGFIGRHLLQRLTDEGVEAVVLGRRPVPGTAFVECDPHEEPQTHAAIARVRPDWIFHLAAAGVHPTDRDPARLHLVNAHWSPLLVRAAGPYGCACVIAGTSAEYRENAGAERLDEDAPVETDKDYGFSKLVGGLAARSMGRATGVPVAVARLFNVYGPGEAPHRLLPAVFRALSSGTPVAMSPGMQVRDFVHVDDACTALLALARGLERGGPSGTFNVATGQGHSVRSFAEEVARALDADPTLLRFGAIPMRPDEVARLVGDPTRLQHAYGWRASTDLATGIARAVRTLRASCSAA